MKRVHGASQTARHAQWLHHPAASLDDGTAIDARLMDDIISEETEKIREMVGPDAFAQGRYDQAVELLRNFIIQPDFPDFLTLEAYNHI